MSDYLNSLVARTLHLAPVVQPRLTSLFEPSAPARWFVPSLEPETVRPDLSAREPTRQVAPVDPGRPPLDQPRTQVSVEPGEREFGSQPRLSVESSELVEKDKERLVPRASALVQAPPRSLSMATSSVPPGSSLVIRSLTKETAAEPNSQTDSTHLQPSPPYVRPRVEPGGPQPIGTSASAITAKHPGMPPTIPARRVSVLPRASADAPQTISVTIGRVDVRAIFPQPSAPRVSQAKQPAAMSLDEYLKQRSEGRR